MADDFGYLGARVRSRRGELLPESFFSEALAVGFEDYLRMLAETPYGAYLTGEGLSDVDRAVSELYRHRVADLEGLASGEAREALRLLFLRADLANVKAILRAKASGRPLEEVRGRFSGGSLPEPVLHALFEAADAAAMAQVLVLPGHPLARALRRAVAEAQDPFEVELLLDRSFLAELVREAARFGDPFAAYFKDELELTNLATAFKLAALGGAEEPERYFVPGGRYVNRALFARIAGDELEAVDELQNTPLSAFAGVRDLAELERRARCFLLARAARAATDVLGPGLVLDYVRRREWEGARVRLLARRAYYRLPEEAVRREVSCG